MKTVRIAIVNRGEPAVRALHTISELSEVGNMRFKTIAMYTEADKNSLFVRWADEAVYLGPSQYFDEGEKRTKHTYLDHDRLFSALATARVDAVWVGWGFVAEDADFAARCEQTGITFIGPSAAAMRILSDKISAKQAAEKAGVPVARWSGGPVDDLHAAEHAERIGYPLLVKAAAGGGGRGIREVADSGSLARLIADARLEAKNAFGDSAVFLEQRISDGRHLEVQVLGDKAGTVWAIGVRECTAQRKRQKVLEESSLAIADQGLEKRLKDYALSICRKVGYWSAGTVEFLYQPETDSVFFMEVNTRLQVEHTVTEVVTGLDLVRWQFQIAFGQTLVGLPPEPRGHAIEVRLNAEDADHDFAPAPGLVTLYRPPNGPGVRVDSGVSQGDCIPPDFDSMIAKIIASGPDRAIALRRLRRALEQTEIVLEGGATNKSFLLDLASQPEIASGRIHTAWINEFVARRRKHARPHAEIAILQAAVEVYEEVLRTDCEHFLAMAGRGRIDVSEEIGKSVELRYEGNLYSCHVRKLAQDQYRVRIDSSPELHIAVEMLGSYERTLVLTGRRYRILVVAEPAGFAVDVQGVAHRMQRNDGGMVRSHFPAMVVAVLATPGQDVVPGTPLFVVESMKMETTVAAELGGRIRQLFVSVGTQIDAGDALAQIDIEAAPEQSDHAARLCFERLSPDETGDPIQIDTVTSLVLGYDIDPKLGIFSPGASASPKSIDAGAIARDVEFLSAFCDIHALAPRRPTLDGGRAADRFLAYLRARARGAETTEEEFSASLSKALARYGLESTDRSSAADEALLRIARSRRYARPQERIVLQTLLRWPQQLEQLSKDEIVKLTPILEQLSMVTEGWSPTISDMAMSVARSLTKDALVEDRKAALARLDERLATLRFSDRPDLAEQIAQLAAATEPWWLWLAPALRQVARRPWLGRLSRQLSAERASIVIRYLEVLIRIQYRDFILREPRVLSSSPVPTLLFEVQYGQKKYAIVTAFVAEGRDREALRKLAAELQKLKNVDETVVELVRTGERKSGNGWFAERPLDLIDRELAEADRVVVTSLGTCSNPSSYFHSFVKGHPGFQEDASLGGLHPNTAKRLGLWRLRNFSISPLWTSDSGCVLAATATENAKDQRLFSFIEIRDIGVARNAAGDIIGIPRLELALREGLDRIRQHHSAVGSRFAWNRIVLVIEPIWDLPLTVLKQVADRIAPITRGLSLDYIVVQMTVADGNSNKLSDTVVHISVQPGGGVQLGHKLASAEPVRILSETRSKSVEMRRQGLVYPYDLVRLLTSPGALYSDFPAGRFEEFDLDPEQRLVPVSRLPGGNVANLVVGIITNFTDKHPEGMSRAIILGDPSRGLGSLGEAECRRIVAVLQLARERRIPVEWFAVSSGARVSMDSGTENMDWTARVLREIVSFTQEGNEINVVVTGINVGAQSYWNAEATMLMHTRGILIMVGQNAMVLTGKQALDFSGGVSADNNFGIGGYDQIMGPNGQAQYWSADIEGACRTLFRHYHYTYRAPNELCPRRLPATDPANRDITLAPIEDPSSDFKSIKHVFDETHNPDRKKPFDVRSVMRAVTDEGDAPLERWAHMRDAETAIVWDAHVGGVSVCLIGIEARELPRLGIAPGDGPRRWTAGTLFPASSKKVARAINAADGSRPVVILANLSGFDGSPESMRRLQLEYGAEIGRAVVNFKGSIIFCVLSRYHGGAFVVFSKQLNDRLRAIAVVGAHASVLGGKPAAAVVFSKEVERRAEADRHVVHLRRALAQAGAVEAATLSVRLQDELERATTEARSNIASEYDAIHTIDRALKVGSIDKIVSPSELRENIIRELNKP